MEQEFKMISFKVTQAELEVVEAKARKSGRKPGAWCREILVAGSGGTFSPDSSLTIGEVASRLHCSERTVRRYVREGGLPSVGEGPARRFDWDRVLTWTGLTPGPQEDEGEAWVKLAPDELPSEEVISYKEVARRLCVERRTLHRYVHLLGMPRTGTGREMKFQWGKVLDWYVLYRLRTASKDGRVPDRLPKRKYRCMGRTKVLESVQAAAAAELPGLAVVVQYEDETGRHELHKVVRWSA